MEYREFGQTGMRLSAVALGGLFGSFAQLDIVGRWVTRRDHRPVNFTIGLLLPFGVVGLLLLALNLYH